LPARRCCNRRRNARTDGPAAPVPGPIRRGRYWLLDALVDYQVEPEDPTRTIPNPERRALDKEIRAARADLAKLEREYGAAAAANAEPRRPTMRGFKIAHDGPISG
jgi:hypothetical protein